MNGPLENQLKVWVQTVSSEPTVAAYKKVLQALILAFQALVDALKVSWDIIKETGKLVWLFLCLGLVAFDWLWDSGNRLVDKAKGLTDQAPDVSSETSLADASKAFLEASKTGAVRAVSQAREQLGLPKVDRGTAGTTVVTDKSPASAPVAAVSETAKEAKEAVSDAVDATAKEIKSEDTSA